MRALMLKEIRSFLNSVTGYLVIVVYLVINSVFLWLIPGNFNLIEGGYSSIDSLFLISPWVFMFLIPAITMRMFADEKRAGTMELLLTKPLTDMSIVWSKFSAGFILVLFSLLPTLIYYFSVYQLGNPVGNIDSGGTFGSYIGLLFLGSSYVAIGVFSSSLTDNQIIAFLIAMFLCFFFYFGFDQIAALGSFHSMELLIISLGISEHYTSMSRGVIDSRDVLYFLGLIVIFALATRLVIQSRKW
ncbi:MAG TPA: gliding motility-associated ABC transporter permease subunit GldF [Cryomorphaceae bacterium]|nr:gliding motility-associated ABC transporter permease subunit GldF [Owenweeksia sp.]MBG00506.1 gliding motility-associated ABC transporter permease subunit GldF [Owenweeksia sp.]HAD96921.1 gliding motility-associated ABC transporter permease subunit GldF [Cryomorphaceae bacterium]HBF20613.1 gliding motility-associated ABC transporter permease subunit GldF [Cryomorphaceae bacterium]HCQ17102.1 gliding motility-associated ABC transporter permease subunit GldF [Cryomorphaceae bacterium]|tara:strand:- start:1387 stop:2118 length:732 start_codon:yes stop_codon:yes gene_type:complete